MHICPKLHDTEEITVESRDNNKKAIKNVRT